MFDWIYQLPVVWMALIILAITWLGTWAIHATVMALAKDQRARTFKAITPGLLSPVARTAVAGWASSMDCSWCFCRPRSGMIHSGPARKSSARRAHCARSYSWRRAIPRTVEPRFAIWCDGRSGTRRKRNGRRSRQIALRVTLQGEGHAVAQREIVAALENAFDARRQRIIISRSGINWVKWTGLIAQAIVTLLAIAMVHSDNRAAAMAMGLFATAVAISIVLIAAHARPFSGEISVGPAVLQEVLPEQEQLPAAGSGK